MGKLWRLTSIVSTAAPGAERGALEAAIELDLGNGGWRAAGDEPPPIYAARMRATSSTDRGMARRLNVQDSDGTLIVSLRPRLTGAAAYIEKTAEAQRKAYLHVVLPDGDRSRMPEAIAESVREWIREAPISVLNVGGPSEDEEPGIQAATRDALVWIFEDEVDAPAPAPAAQHSIRDAMNATLAEAAADVAWRVANGARLLEPGDQQRDANRAALTAMHACGHATADGFYVCDLPAGHVEGHQWACVKDVDLVGDLFDILPDSEAR